MKTLGVGVAVVCVVGLLAGCAARPSPRVPRGVVPPKPDYTRPLARGELALRKVTNPSDIPDFTAASSDRAGLREAIRCSLDYLAHPSSNKFYPYGEITHRQVAASLEAFSEMLDARMSSQDINAAIREKFDVYTSVGWDDKGAVFFTGYYTPIFDASRVRTEWFACPLYRLPNNLEKSAEGETLGLRGPAGQIAPCPSRREIESGQLFAGNEIFWLADPFEAYIAHLQGSARLRLPKDEMVTVGYAGSNGHEYRSVAEELIRDGKMRREELSMQAVMNYFKAHPAEVQEYVWRNPRYIFFAETGGPPRGSLNQPVTPMRSIATDKAVFPRAALAFIDVNLPRRVGGAIRLTAYEGFALDQDTGGAIRAAGRCDIYMGIGHQAGEMAGRVAQEGRLYYLFLKPALVGESAPK
jgi:membrane-bound lytic murein transglycosylase A